MRNEQSTNYAYKLKYMGGNRVEIVCPKLMILLFLKK